MPEWVPSEPIIATTIALAIIAMAGVGEARAWHEQLEKLVNGLNVGSERHELSPEEARKMGEEELSRSIEGGQGDGKSSWLRAIRQSGAAKDRAAAAAVQVQEEPVTALPSIESLVLQAEGARGKGGKRAADKAVDALSELFRTSLLPDGRKLRRLDQQPLGLRQKEGGKWQRRLLALYAFEDGLKKKYARFVAALEELSKDPLEHLKHKAMRAIRDLLVAKPEQEQELLSALVNKLGDPQRKVASKASHLLRTVLEFHPGMKRVVAREVMAMCKRPNVPPRAKYYSVVFLHQLPLSHKGSDPSLAEDLVAWYVELFASLMEAGSAKSREEARRQRLTKAQRRREKRKLEKKGAAASNLSRFKEREPRGIDARILRAILTGVNRAFPYVKPAAADRAARNMEPDLYRMAHAGSVKAALQALLLLKQLQSSRHAALDRFYRALYSALLHPEMPASSQASSFLSLVFRSAKEDTSSERQHAFVKRLLQVSSSAPPQFACGVLLLVSELCKERPHLTSAIQEPEAAPPEEEALADRLEGNTSAEPAPSTLYDMRKREPLYARAGGTCWWELAALGEHGHPAVAAMAGTLLRGGSVVYGGDPLQDLSMVSFLDKFLNKSRPKRRVERTPLVERAGMESARQPVEKQGWGGEGVAPEEVFFHKFYQQRRKGRDKGQAEEDKKEEEEEEHEEASDDEVDRALEGEEEGIEGEPGDVDYSQLEMPHSEEEDDEDEGGAVEIDWPDEGEEEEEEEGMEGENEGPFAAAEEYESLLEGAGEAGGTEASVEEVLKEAARPGRGKKRRRIP